MNKKELKELKEIIGKLESGKNDLSLFLNKASFDYLQKNRYNKTYNNQLQALYDKLFRIEACINSLADIIEY